MSAIEQSMTIDMAVEILADLISDERENAEYDRGASQAIAASLHLLNGEDDVPGALLTLAWAVRRDREARGMSSRLTSPHRRKGTIMTDSTYSVEICDRATGGKEFYEMTIETARSHMQAARKAIRPMVGSVITLDSEPALGGDMSTRSRDRFYGTRDYTITVWKHAPSN